MDGDSLISLVTNWAAYTLVVASLTACGVFVSGVYYQPVHPPYAIPGAKMTVDVQGNTDAILCAIKATRAAEAAVTNGFKLTGTPDVLPAP